MGIFGIIGLTMLDYNISDDKQTQIVDNSFLTSSQDRNLDDEEDYSSTYRSLLIDDKNSNHSYSVIAFEDETIYDIKLRLQSLYGIPIQY